jgi:hypothetical protein
MSLVKAGSEKERRGFGSQQEAGGKLGAGEKLLARKELEAGEKQGSAEGAFDWLLTTLSWRFGVSRTEAAQFVARDGAFYAPEFREWCSTFEEELSEEIQF